MVDPAPNQSIYSCARGSMGAEHADETVDDVVHHQRGKDVDDGRPSPPELSASAVAVAAARSPQWMPSSLQGRSEEQCKAVPGSDPSPSPGPGPGTQSRFLNLR